MKRKVSVANKANKDTKSAKNKPIKKKPIPAKWYWLGGAAFAAIVAVTVFVILYYTEPDPVVARAGGVNINETDISFHFGQAQESVLRQIETIGDDIEMFLRAVREEAVRLAVVDNLYEEHARRLGISLSRDERRSIRANVDSLVFEHGRLEFENQLEMSGFRNRAHLEAYFQNIELSNHVIDAIIASPAEFARFEPYVEQEAEVEVLAAKHILAHFDNFDTEEDAESFATDILNRILAGEDFDTLMREYSQDPGLEFSPDGYTFTSGFMVSEFEQATRDIQIGEIIGPIRTIHGYHIIQRIEPNLDDIMGHVPPSLTPEQQMSDAIVRGFEAMANEVEITFRPALDNVEF